MKNSLIALLIVICTSCSTNFICVTGNDIPIYHDKYQKEAVIATIPKGETVLVRGKRKYRKITYSSYTGWAYSPYFTSEMKYSYLDRNNTYKRKNTSTYSGGSVKVKGYYRKDGTYVRPHTRSAPKRRKY